MSPSPRPTSPQLRILPQLLAKYSSPAAESLQKKYFLTNTVLGSGKFGQVKLGTCRRTQKKVAVKVISKHLLKQRMLRTLHREVQILTELTDSGSTDIVGLLDYYDDPDELYLVMELATSVDLFERIIQRGRYSESQARCAFHSMVRSVAHIHSHGICHRDIKPENFMCMLGSEDVKLIDFGLSKKFGQGFAGGSRGLHRMSSRVGTPYYIAPEVVGGQNYDAAVDMWSLGVVFYIMLSGFPPFNGSTDQEIFKNVRRAKVDFSDPVFDAVSTDAKNLIIVLLTVDPSKRPTARQALQSPFFNGLGAETEAKVTSKVNTVSVAVESSSSSSSSSVDTPVPNVDSSGDPASCDFDAASTSTGISINEEVFQLDLSVATVQRPSETRHSKLRSKSRSIRGRVHQIGALLWEVMEQAHSTQFGQLLARPIISKATAAAPPSHSYAAAV